MELHSTCSVVPFWILLSVLQLVCPDPQSSSSSCPKGNGVLSFCIPVPQCNTLRNRIGWSQGQECGPGPSRLSATTTTTSTTTITTPSPVSPVVENYAFHFLVPPPLPPGVHLPTEALRKPVTATMRKPTGPLPLPPYLDECHKVWWNRRIINGTEVNPHQYPFMAVLGYVDPLWEQFKQLCGGTLITNQHVLTAAHCLVQPKYI
ncbi:unnamed protein product [Cyprideis torosa]|uniref:Uncharacterized protein n=1 Tax=Cyprideis torosa TaxID=163714 RepID=A0A7R8ZS00_9CRUS|nr:unnamed protein product [Cyprideis torosa]CAG0894357.1 unnamed protein product [Cyprideis torosa]